MTRFTRFFTAAALLVLVAPTLVGQASSQSADATASVVITPVLTLAKTTDMSFGTHFASDGLVYSSAEARWDGTTDVGNHLSVSFTLPTQLQRVGNGDAVPVTYGANSAAISSGGSLVTVFNPTTGVADFGPVASLGSFNVRLGFAPNLDNGVSVNLTGRLPGTYQGIITLTVTVL